MRILIVPDSFKGSLTAVAASETMAGAVLAEMPDAEVFRIPLADGGEGTVDALVAARGGRTVPIEVTGPLGERVQTYYGVIGETTAVVEAANLCGLTMVPPERRNPLHTTSRALGEAILAALDQSSSRIIVGLGGSAVNDGGIGMLSALGAVFLDGAGHKLSGYGRDLPELDRIDLSGLDSRLKRCEITVACDVRNPLVGEEGATFVYGPQKGASAEMCRTLDAAMAAYAAKLEACFADMGMGAAAGGAPLRDAPGAGAAGGLGFALLSLGAKLVPGAQLIEEQTGLRAAARAADWVLTGEGRSDGQTLYGKLPLHVARLAREEGTRAVLISGSLGPGSERLLSEFAGCFSIVEQPSSLQDCMEQAESLLYRCTRSVARLIAQAAGR
ncbi:glycerate kinase [Cohnella caldifontis]|uniref:glycerate kinase n=1 Tax=Cohnella caldifontis TaxID=3027471 RepID=UPI0023EE05B8|nr:glycerate kinase [Cohnella sp. YIM B05605]